MITLTDTVAGAQAEILRIQSGMSDVIDAGITEALDSLIGDLIPVTPVKTGAMQADYTIASGGSVWELLDTAESPRGYPYPGRIVFDPGFSAAYDALQAVLDSADDRIGTSVSALLSGLVGTP